MSPSSTLPDRSATTAGSGTVARVNRWPVILLVAICLLSAALAAFEAWHVPPYMDEGTFSDAAYNLSHHGFMGTTVLETAGTGLTRLDRHTYWVMPLYLIGQAAWMLVAPTSLFGVRLFSILWIPVSVFALYIFMRRIGCPEPPALFAAAFHGLSFVLIDTAKNARPDMMCQALGWSAMAVYAALRERSLVLALCAGNALVALAGLTHPNGILYFAGLWLMVFWLDRAKLRVIHFAAPALVYAALAAVWSIYIFQDPSAFVEQMRANSDHRLGEVAWSSIHLPLPLRLVWGEIHDRYLAVFGLLSPIPLSRLKGLVLLTYVAALLALLTAPLRRQPATGLLASLLALFFVIQCVFNQKLGLYFIHIEPLYAAITGLAAAALWSWRRGLPRLLLAAWFLMLAGMQVSFAVTKAVSLSTAASQREVAGFLASEARSARLIFGSACLIHTVGYDPRYRDDRYLGVRSGRHADVIVLADHLDADLYLDLRLQKPADWEKISQRLAEYRLVFSPPGYRVYFTPEMAAALHK
jgi:4-amino-4-deoxy-L-arabinose transferase-like glycosyltransferase